MAAPLGPRSLELQHQINGNIISEQQKKLKEKEFKANVPKNTCKACNRRAWGAKSDAKRGSNKRSFI
jgi:hypothetical protein